MYGVKCTAVVQVNVALPLSVQTLRSAEGYSQQYFKCTELPLYTAIIRVTTSIPSVLQLQLRSEAASCSQVTHLERHGHGCPPCRLKHCCQIQQRARPLLKHVRLSVMLLNTPELKSIIGLAKTAINLSCLYFCKKAQV